MLLSGQKEVRSCYSQDIGWPHVAKGAEEGASRITLSLFSVTTQLYTSYGYTINEFLIS